MEVDNKVSDLVWKLKDHWKKTRVSDSLPENNLKAVRKVCFEFFKIYYLQNVKVGDFTLERDFSVALIIGGALQEHQTDTGPTEFAKKVAAIMREAEIIL